MPSSRPVRADARRNREALVARAREIFAAGDEGVRYDDFAGMAGVGTGTLYRHFPTREELAAAVYQQEMGTLCELARTLQATLSASEALAAFLHRMVDYIDVNRRLARRLAALLAAAPAVTGGSGQDLEQVVADLVSAAVQDGDARSGVPAGSVMMALHGIGAAHDRLDWRAEADGVITLVLEGLRPLRPDRRRPESHAT